MLLRCLIVAFTGDQAASVVDEAAKALPAERVVGTAMQALDWQIGWQLVISGSSF